MNILNKKTRQIFLLLGVIMLAGCSGLKPYQWHDEREEGLKTGLFSGADGEFVILDNTNEKITVK
ncbi:MULTISPECIES: hypothetical protein [Pseudoalteromonas]|nr:MULTISPECIES: hypothetical protein [Pseudoalteromonas]MBB1407502.1 hypothetical protein [Pseudoalteromonas sp. SG44-5]MBH0073316.1 hypothetical protein [Pseudoalteromonas sp. NZS127]MBH0094746.1 hypothetical protein [Pseudoalteromonas sp. SCQQ13]|tara:strand:- start:1273 stop:1467 length:195 start_codon:yes stop_codon:yes gene_type:complete